MSFAYPAEKFSSARSALTSPHAEGEHEAVVRAFQECRLGLHRMSRGKLDAKARVWIHRIECFMDTTGFVESGGESAWTIKAKSLTAEEKAEIFRVVDDLARWFDSQED